MSLHAAATPAHDLELHRAALLGHCYRMLGSVVDAEDAVQETMLRAWKALPGFDGRSALRTWLYRIATNVCLDERAARMKRARPTDEGARITAETVPQPLPERPRTHWLEPVPDVAALPADADADPAEVAVLRQSIRLAFVAALQHLPPRQRAGLLLTEVLGWSAAEVASALDTSVAAVNSAVQRARATLQARADVQRPAPLPAEQSALLERFVDAFHRYDVDALTALLHDDAVMTMPPFDMWLQGPDAISGWLRGPGLGCQGSRLLATAACGQPAFAQYRQGGRQAWGLVVLELGPGGIAGWNTFLDVETLFPRFGLPLMYID
jgi:RNA polymerase sigma-70 factor, ECF subfamily